VFFTMTTASSRKRSFSALKPRPLSTAYIPASFGTHLKS
jgi:hypothetical protein